jgi:hypothetical protein
MIRLEVPLACGMLIMKGCHPAALHSRFGCPVVVTNGCRHPEAGLNSSQHGKGGLARGRGSTVSDLQVLRWYARAGGGLPSPRRVKMTKPMI